MAALGDLIAILVALGGATRAWPQSHKMAPQAAHVPLW